MLKLKNYLPKDVYATVFDIDYNKLYEEGKRIILLDIDNTLISYEEDLPTVALLELFKEIKEIGFEIIFISNNKKERVKKFSETINAKYVYTAMKPLSRGYRKVMKQISPRRRFEVVAVGDQIMTDVLGANRFGIDVYLVKPLAVETEKWYTNFNRFMEDIILKRIKKRYPETYEKLNGWKD